MKYVAITLAAVAAILGAVWASVGGVALGIGIGMLTFIAVIFAAFGLGSWWSARLMQAGANIALTAQTSDDNRDRAQIGALAGLVKETLKITGRSQAPTQYPQLSIPPPADNIPDADFTVSGLDDEPIQ